MGVGPSMASRVRNGQRLPSVKVLNAIAEELDLPLERLVSAHCAGPEAFGELIRDSLMVVIG